MEHVKNFIRESILNDPEYFRSENIETKQPPIFIIYCARGNNREMVNIYFDYKTSFKFINRKILQLGYWDNFTLDQLRDIERSAREYLKEIGLESIGATSNYQNEGKV